MATTNNSETKSDSFFGRLFKKTKRVLIKATIIIIILLIAVLYFISNYHYSEGTRTGYLSKFSKKGYVFKTYEGDLYVGGANADNSTLVNNSWFFSVASGDKQAIEEVQKNQGKVVKLYYYQVIKSMFWQGDQEYFVYKAEFVREK